MTTARGLRLDLAYDLADPLVWFGCDYGVGDPLRWSPDSVYLLMMDWMPRMMLGLDAEELEYLPDVFAAFIRYTHGLRRMQPELTAETVDAVERWRDEFLRRMRLAAADSESEYDDWDEDDVDDEPDDE